MSKVDAYAKKVVEDETSIPNFDKVIGNNLKRFRKERGLNQAEFAAKLDMDAKYLSHLERGDYRWSRKRVIKAMEILGVTPNQVFPSYLSANTSNEKFNKVLISFFALSQEDQKELVTLFEMQVGMMEKRENSNRFGQNLE